ncbi:hypothetical protein GSI_15193 [Ganoderma sinense ZZ0214-1]|uniref:Uncharacterized protein n=1 Tax=Ganoderma sinense ZZ0214-1 TaxID=1077348 RepID=A0A2G8RLW2_9APHY|nr:hypothetical protein GSI_15193 [Ganoderma sinense ZZ0214-1]
MGYVPIRKTAARSQDETSAPSTYLDIWLFFNIAGDQILLPFLVLTLLFSRAVTRYPTVINVCVTWIIAGIVSSLLFYTGQHVGPEPGKGTCIAQMALFASVPPMTAVATLALVYYTWSTCRCSKLHTGPKARMSRLTTICLLVVPYVVYTCFVVVGTYLGLRYPESVDRSRRLFYCSIGNVAFNNVIVLFTAGVCLLTAALQAHLFVLLSQSWSVFRRAGLGTGVDIQLATRVGIFVAYLVATSCVMLSTFAPAMDAHRAFPDLFGTSTGTTLFLVFATHPDILRAWSHILLFPFNSCRPSEANRPPCCTPTPAPSFDDSLLKRTDSEVSEKARLSALHAYFVARVTSAGSPVEVIKRPEDAFMQGKRAWGTNGDWGTHWR